MIIVCLPLIWPVDELSGLFRTATSLSLFLTMIIPLLFYADGYMSGPCTYSFLIGSTYTMVAHQHGKQPDLSHQNYISGFNIQCTSTSLCFNLKHIIITIADQRPCISETASMPEMTGKEK